MSYLQVHSYCSRVVTGFMGMFVYVYAYVCVCVYRDDCDALTLSY